MELTKLKPNTDQRGTLYEVFKTTMGQVFVITIEPGHTRGHHFHLRKIEKFVVASGSAEISIREKGNVYTALVNADEPKCVTIYPPLPHSIYSEDGCILVCWVSEVFDKDDPDTYPEEV